MAPILEHRDTRKKIVLQATSRQINDIKALIELPANQVESIGTNLYSLDIDVEEVKAPKILLDISVGDFQEKESSAATRVPTFKNSELFYKNSSTRRGYKIISDEFSDELNYTLYKGFNRIESELRQLILENNIRKGGLTIDSTSYKQKAPDHPVSTFQLSDFIEKLLNAPASDGYMKAEWHRCKNKDENDVVRIAKLTRIDEIKPGLSLEELGTLRSQRNKCMHFNVVTVQDYKIAAPLINKYLKTSANRMISRTFTSLSDSLSKHIEELSVTGGLLRKYYESQINSTVSLSDMLRKYIDDMQ